MDWHSRAVLSCRQSNTLDAGVCLQAQEYGLEFDNHPRLHSALEGRTPWEALCQGATEGDGSKTQTLVMMEMAGSREEGRSTP